MKRLKSFSIFLCVLLFTEGLAKANTYYFSSSVGDDGRTITEAQNPATPWKSINKLNSLIFLLAPGDSVLFKRGDTFYGTIKIQRSGLAPLPIVFSAYGSGSQPILTGLVTLSGWMNAGNGILEANCPLCNASDNVVIINGVLQRIGRYPNTGYLKYQSYSGNNSITSNQLSGVPDWTGAEIVVRKNHWIIDRNKINSQSGGTINYTSASTYNGTNNFGFFIQNAPGTLDTMGEWYFNPANNNMMVYFGSNNPSDYTVQASTIDTLIYIQGQSYLVFDNLMFEGANKFGFLINASNNITIQNCNFDNSGNDAIRCESCDYFTLTNSIINHTLNDAIDLGYSSNNSSITNNIIRNTGYIAGMGGSGDGAYIAISPGLDGTTIKHNKIDSTGYSAIYFHGNADVVEDNFINTFCFVKDDGGGIYAYTGSTPLTYKQRLVKNNIIINGIGAPNGTNGALEAHGIYMDSKSSQVSIDSNTIYNMNSAAVFLSSTNNLSMRGNVIFNNPYSLNIGQWNTGDITRDTIVGNYLVAKDRSQYALLVELDNGVDDISGWGIFDSNYYCRPVDEDSSIAVAETSNQGLLTYMNIAGWQSYSGKDVHSKKSPVHITDTSQILFRYNAASSNQTIPLNGTYIGMDSILYSNRIVIKPFSSVVLIKVSNNNLSPIADAGSDQTISLPLDSITLDGSASHDPDGKIVSWHWSTQSGPGAVVFSNSDSAKTEVSGLEAGTYVFNLTVTDDSGATASAQVSAAVTNETTGSVVPRPSNQSPVANAGLSQTITLPADSVTLDGSASYDPDGMIVSYLWIKKKGPSPYSIANDTIAKTEITGLDTGVYVFTLTVKDDSGAINSADVTITVKDPVIKPPPNQAPVASAGSNQLITLPMDSVSLDGSSSYDPDGKIISWKWTRQSGPATFNLKNDSSAQTTVTGLIAGVYVFHLMVTDNRGLTTSANVSIIVNQPPVANAGNDTALFLPDDSALLEGAASYDPDGKVVSWSWSQKSGPTTPSILQSDSAKASVNQLVNGVYVFTLIVTDNNGAEDTADVTISVYKKPNQPPVAEAGGDITIVLPQSSVILNGAASYDPDGTIIKYHWDPITGPVKVGMTTPDSSSTVVSGFQMGTYDFRLTVADNNGLSSTATVSVYVLPGNDTVATTFQIYPNPVHDQLNVQLNKSVTGLLAFRIIDLNGRILKIYQFGQLPMHITKVLDVSSLIPGIYFVQLIEDNQLTDVVKMIKY